MVPTTTAEIKDPNKYWVFKKSPYFKTEFIAQFLSKEGFGYFNFLILRLNTHKVETIQLYEDQLEDQLIDQLPLIRPATEEEIYLFKEEVELQSIMNKYNL